MRQNRRAEHFVGRNAQIGRSQQTWLLALTLPFQPDQLTMTVVEGYLTWLNERRKGSLATETDQRIEITAQQQVTPRVLKPNQRLVLRHLVEQADSLRGAARFALGYWAK